VDTPTFHHKCLECRKEELAPTRTGENHVAFRFGDQLKYRIFWEDTDVTDWTTEAQAGRAPDGWILKLCALGPKRSPHPCQSCGGAYCAWRLDGNVRIESVREALKE
jgi:hypothetical protein